MAWIFVDKEEEGGAQEKMRSQMRSMMRSGGYRGGGYREGGSYREGYKLGYHHGWVDKEDEWDEDPEYRRRRDSRGRFM